MVPFPRGYSICVYLSHFSQWKTDEQFTQKSSALEGNSARKKRRNTIAFPLRESLWPVSYHTYPLYTIPMNLSLCYWKLARQLMDQMIFQNYKIQVSYPFLRVYQDFKRR